MKGDAVEIDRDEILGMLRERGQEQEADKAEQELPSKVDPDRDAGMLQKYGIDPSDVLSRVTGGRDLPGF
jgi:hypothetical protein